MTLATFDYVRARDIADAIRLLRENEDAKLLAGGHSLIPMMKLRLAMPPLLIDITEIPGMRGIVHENACLTFGALTTHREVAESPVVRAASPALADAASEIGDPQVRNRGTMGGSCSHGDPAADYPAVMLALDAAFTITNGTESRETHADDFFLGMFDTAIAFDEIMTSIRIADAPCSSYVKMLHPASGYAVVGVAAALKLDGDAIASARFGVSGVAAGHFRPLGVEAALVGVRIDDRPAIAAACRNAADGVDVLGDRYASSAYRTAMADVFIAKAIEKARRNRGRNTSS